MMIEPQSSGGFRVFRDFQRGGVNEIFHCHKSGGVKFTSEILCSPFVKFVEFVVTVLQS